MRNLKAAKAALALLAAAAMCDVQAAGVSYATPGATYSQDFDTLPNSPFNTSLGATPAGWMDDTAAPGAGNFSIVGWYLYHPTVQSEGGANGNQRMRIGAGTANTGSFWSHGAADSTDRALASLASNTMGAEMYMGLLLQNNTGETLGSFTLGYNGEQWRDGGANGGTPVAQSLAFGWSTTATAISDAGFNSVAELGYNSPVFVNTGSGAAVDGNAAGRVAVGPFAVENINWASGEYLWLRWADVNNSGNDHGFGIDDLTFSAAAVVPEPSMIALIGLGIAGLLFRRKN
jgi:hypothetical protein